MNAPPRSRFLSAASIALLLAAPIASANLLGDPGFEIDPIDDVPFTAWTAFNNAIVSLDAEQQSGGTIQTLLTATDDPQQIAEALVDGALEGGSRDNITAVVVIVD